MMLSVMSDLGQISRYPPISQLDLSVVCVARGTGDSSMIRMRCDATSYVCDAPDIQTPDP